MMILQFTKMQGAGNDFVVIDLVSQQFNDLSASLMAKLADRHFGIGCDQILVIEPPSLPENDFKYRIFNADGSEVEQCGNGARCFAAFVQKKGLTGQKDIRVETAKGVIILHVRPQGIQVNMGEPILSPEQIPFKHPNRQNQYPIAIDDITLNISAVSMGNPHVVYQVDDLTDGTFERLGPQLESHPDFPEKANAGFMQIINPKHIKLRVFERGVGETLACGTGACAAVVSGILLKQLAHKVQVDLPGGTLYIEWQGEGHPVFQTGPAEFVFEGNITV